MPAAGAKSKTERLEARIPGDVKSILTRAASLQGRSLTDFVVGSATEAARRVIRENDVLEMSERDQAAHHLFLVRKTVEPLLGGR